MHQGTDELFPSRDQAYIRVVAEGIPNHDPRHPEGDFRFPEVLFGSAWLTKEEYEKGFFLAKDEHENWVYVHRTCERALDDHEIWRTMDIQKEIEDAEQQEVRGEESEWGLYPEWDPEGDSGVE